MHLPVLLLLEVPVWVGAAAGVGHEKVGLTSAESSTLHDVKSIMHSDSEWSKAQAVINIMRVTQPTAAKIGLHQSHQMAIGFCSRPCVCRKVAVVVENSRIAGISVVQAAGPVVTEFRQ